MSSYSPLACRYKQYVTSYVAFELANLSATHPAPRGSHRLRLAGKSVREIREALGPVGKRTLSAALKGTPPADWTRRPNAKDDLREKARELRAQGLSYNETAQLDVSKSSVSLWVRGLPCPERFKYVHNERRREGLRRPRPPGRDSNLSTAPGEGFEPP